MSCPNKKQYMPGTVKFTTWQKALLPLWALFFLLGAMPVYAEEKSAEEWQADVVIYLWGASIKSTTATGDPLTFNFGTLLKKLDLAWMSTINVRKDKFSVLADVIYMDVSDTKRYEREFLGQPVSGKVDVGLKTLVLNLVGGYNLVDTGKNIFDINAGARYLDVTVDGTLKANDKKRQNSYSDSGWDAVVGFKGRHNYPDGYYLNYYVDVGGGASKLTWQATANFSYDYKKFTTVVGYRYLKWNLKNDAPALDDLAIHGPYLGIKFRF